MAPAHCCRWSDSAGASLSLSARRACPAGRSWLGGGPGRVGSGWRVVGCRGLGVENWLAGGGGRRRRGGECWVGGGGGGGGLGGVGWLGRAGWLGWAERPGRDVRAGRLGREHRAGCPRGGGLRGKAPPGRA